MSNVYFDSPFTVRRLKREPGVTVYHYNTECPMYYSPGNYYIRRIAAPDVPAVLSESAPATPCPHMAEKHCPHGYPVRHTGAGQSRAVTPARVPAPYRRTR